MSQWFRQWVDKIIYLFIRHSFQRVLRRLFITSNYWIYSILKCFVLLGVAVLI